MKLNNELTLKKETVSPNDFYTDQWMVKNGRKQYARITKAHWKQTQNKPEGMFSITIICGNGGISWNKHTFEDCIAQVNEQWKGLKQYTY